MTANPFVVVRPAAVRVTMGRVRMRQLRSNAA